MAGENAARGGAPGRVTGVFRPARAPASNRSATLRAMPQPPAALRAPFREREFYLAEFRGRTLALVLPRECRLGGAEREVVSGVLMSECVKIDESPSVEFP